MRFVDLSLTDFGVYRNARLDGIEEGINVIAGPQRAGKTTFMQAVRRLPFGIRGTDLPPATNTYELAATVGHEGDEYALRVRGQGAPRLDPLDGGEEITLDELVGGLTRAQYRQLCTVSLRELRRLPEGIESQEDLAEILLGAAYGEISHVPALRDEFASDAYAIGAKYGRKNVSALKTATERIERAVTKREEATRTVAEYDAKQSDLADIERRLGAIDERETTLEGERTRLSLLEKWFDELGVYRETRAELNGRSEPIHEYPTDAVESARSLRSELREAREKRAAARADLATHADRAAVADDGAGLLERTAAITAYDRRIEKWRSQGAAIAESGDDLESTRRDLERKVQKLRADWEALDAVRRVTADELTRERVRDVTTRVESLRDEREATERARDAKRSELAILETDLERAEAASEGQRDGAAGSQQAPLVGAGIALAGLVVGAGLGTIGLPVVGYLVAAVGIGAGFYYTKTKIGRGDASVDGEPVRELKATISNRRAAIDGLERTLEAVEERLADAEAELASLRERFDLPEESSPKAVRDFYDTFVSLRANVRSYDDRTEAHEAERRSLAETLRTVAESVAPLVEFDWDGWDDEGDRGERVLRKRSDELFDACETAMAAVRAAERLDEANRAVEDVQSAARELLANWVPNEEDGTDLDASLRAYATAAAKAQKCEVLRAEMAAIESRIESDFRRSATVEAFGPVLAAVGTDGGTTQGVEETDSEETEENGLEDPAEWSVPALERLADRYATGAEIDARLEGIEQALTALDAEREELRTRRAEVRERLATLASDEDLRTAQAEIQRGRERLRALGEEYATHRLAEALLDRLHDRFIEEATGPLLDEASAIFSRITATYDGVTHTGELDALAFEARRNGTANLETSALSRATAEQLFLSVRLARIRTVEESVPIVVDDAMTNFDPAHTRRTLSFLADLARTNQVLLLTCHPEIVRLADEVAAVGGYWCLDDGRFDGPVNDPTEVCAFLDAG